MKKDLKQLKEDVFKLQEETQNIEAQSVKTMQSLFDATHKLRIIINELVEPNKCLYCKKNTTDSIDPNVLCSQCRETFGHTFYNEL